MLPLYLLGKVVRPLTDQNERVARSARLLLALNIGKYSKTILIVYLAVKLKNKILSVLPLACPFSTDTDSCR